MITIRPFRNSDSPHLARLWNARSPHALRFAPMTPRVLDDTVFARLHFDPLGLHVAVDDGMLVGFAHGSFGPTPDGGRLSHEVGAISAIVARPDRSDVVTALVASLSDYLRSHGARTLLAGGIDPIDPFYGGLDGGCRSGGIVSTDMFLVAAFLSAGFQVTSRWTVWQRGLSDFRVPVDRTQMHFRNSCRIELVKSPESLSWWEATTLGNHLVTRYAVSGRSLAGRNASVCYWDLSPLADASGERAAALLDLHCDETAWHDGLCQFLLAGSLKMQVEAGASLAQMQFPAVDESQPPGVHEKVLRQLGFAPVEHKIVLAKQAG